MSYDALELSVESGQPVELYEFRQGSNVYLCNNTDEDVFHLAVRYEPTQISRGDMNVASNMDNTELTLTFPRDHEYASTFIGYKPDFITTVTILRGHLSDTSDDFTAYWKGRVVNSKVSNSEITLTCESVFTSLRRHGLRARYQRNCRHVLYSTGCGLDINSVRIDCTVTAISGDTIFLSYPGTYANGYFSGGMVRTLDGATRFIANHTGHSMKLTRPFNDLGDGDQVYLFPGCDHLKTTCKDKFNNLVNFGGFPYIPDVNPFGGDSLV